MIDITTYSPTNPGTAKDQENIVDFLFESLEQYGDPKHDIQKCLEYALGKNGKPGGLVLAAKDPEMDRVVGAVILNKTGMGSYIPENILVYIATDKAKRGQGLGKTLMQEAIDRTEGGIALHCEPDNPARFLYEKLGFTSKYLEMRLKK